MTSSTDSSKHLPESIPNPSLALLSGDYSGTGSSNGNGKLRIPIDKRLGDLVHSNHELTPVTRYYAKTTGIVWPPEIRDYNYRFTQALNNIKKRHDPTVTTVAQGVLEWKRNRQAKDISSEIQTWLDRFYLSRIGIRFLIGQRE